jgi:hypothetical protein
MKSVKSKKDFRNIRKTSNAVKSKKPVDINKVYKIEK